MQGIASSSRYRALLPVYHEEAGQSAAPDRTLRPLHGSTLRHIGLNYAEMKEGSLQVDS
jgi:hypothetical protein